LTTQLPAIQGTSKPNGCCVQMIVLMWLFQHLQAKHVRTFSSFWMMRCAVITVLAASRPRPWTYLNGGRLASAFSMVVYGCLRPPQACLSSRLARSLAGCCGPATMPVRPKATEVNLPDGYCVSNMVIKRPIQHFQAHHAPAFLQF
jgi:hypothetical protein